MPVQVILNGLKITTAVVTVATVIIKLVKEAREL